MPYTTRRYRRPYRNTRKRVYRRKNVATKRYVKTMIKATAEKKYHDVQFIQSQSVTPIITDLTSTTNGTSDITRIGDKITISSLRMQGALNVGDTSNQIRVLLFQWHPSSTLIAPSASDILQDPLNPVLSFYNHDMGSNFTVLRDKVYSLVTGGTNASIRLKWRLSFYNARKRGAKKFWRNVIKYDAGTDEGSDKIYMMTVSDSGAAGHPTISMEWRLNFIDL